MINNIISIEAIQTYCKSRPIKRLSLFGSVLRPDFTSQSDVDVLVEFEPGIKITYFDLFHIQSDLEQIIQRRVDLLTPGAISDYFRDDVLATAQVIYDAYPASAATIALTL